MNFLVKWLSSFLKGFELLLVGMIVVILLVLNMTFPVSAQPEKQNYPLIGWQTFSGAVEDFYARFDLIISRHNSASWAREMQRLNPNILLLFTYDWNTAQYPYIASFPEEWFLYTSSHQKVSAYGEYMMVNLSDLCPRAKSGPMAGMTYMEYLPIWLTQQVDMNVYDGLATDGVWGKSEMYWLYNGSQFANVDIDNNGVNDHSEHDKDWFLNHWQAGIDKMLVDLRQRIGNDKLIVINSGNRHDWGWSETNGIIVEKMEGYFDDKFSNDYFNNFKKLCPKPFISVADGLPHSSNPDMAKPTKDDFLGMRFGLVTCMFNDLYFSFQNLEADEHYWSYWYDEFDTDLGQPTGSPKEIRPGLWVRFFERGCAIAGVNGSPQTATNEDLCKFSEYFGPYFRFKGGQNPDLNNGSQFDSVSLKGRIYDDHYFGDGIILLKQPLAVIADIILDNSDSGTSPSNNPAALQDGFQQNSECSSNAYTVRCASWQDTYGYATASPGSATAVFTPNIGLAGSYQVCEWHPTFDGGASNVNYTIIHAGGQKNVKIDQNANGGRWNSLGSYFFNKGTNGKIIISASGANGIVSADAIKFVYGGTDSNRDISAPNPPGGVKIKN